MRVRLVSWNYFKSSIQSVLLTVSRRCFFCGSFVIHISWLSSVMLCCLLHCSLVVTCQERANTSWFSCMWCFLAFLSLFHVVSWVRCGTWFYRFLIIVFSLTLFQTIINSNYSGVDIKYVTSKCFIIIILINICFVCVKETSQCVSFMRPNHLLL